MSPQENPVNGSTMAFSQRASSWQELARAQWHLQASSSVIALSLRLCPPCQGNKLPEARPGWFQAQCRHPEATAEVSAGEVLFAAETLAPHQLKGNLLPESSLGSLHCEVGIWPRTRCCLPLLEVARTLSLRLYNKWATDKNKALDGQAT